MNVNDREWLRYIDESRLFIYPIQLANCDRLRKHKAVYIFDEVGSGKTISSGLMALDYLFNNENKKVLIITINSLISQDGISNGQFLDDWYDKLPFKALKLDKRIIIVNNHNKNIKKATLNDGETYGLVIIDEAHLFLNKDSERYKALSKLRADKVVFLTASPIKNSKDDLTIYEELANNITFNNSYNMDPGYLLNEISTSGKKKKSVICSKFDLNCSATRYFKDTIKSIDKIEYKEKKAKRLFPLIWKYEKDKGKIDCLVQHINNIIKDKQAENRFVIFVRYIEDEENIVQELEKHKFTDFFGGNPTEEKTYAKINGKLNRDKLISLSGTENLPTILILTYQIAEEGVNLPGFNYVINYHIPAYPSSLEQRFGRIDRMNSKFDKIHICFLIKLSSPYGSDTLNFYSAIKIYLKELVPYFPSKNTLLSQNIINEYKEHISIVDTDREHLITIIDNKMDAIIKNIDTNPDEIKDPDLLDILDFINKSGIEITSEITEKELKTNIKKFLPTEKNSINSICNLSEDDLLKLLKNDIEEGDTKKEDEINEKIFYCKSAKVEGDKEMYSSLQMIDAVTECGRWISESEKFKEYRELFNRMFYTFSNSEFKMMELLCLDDIWQSHSNEEIVEKFQRDFIEWYYSMIFLDKPNGFSPEEQVFSIRKKLNHIHEIRTYISKIMCGDSAKNDV